MIRKRRVISISVYRDALSAIRELFRLCHSLMPAYAGSDNQDAMKGLFEYALYHVQVFVLLYIILGSSPSRSNSSTTAGRYLYYAHLSIELSISRPTNDSTCTTMMCRLQ
jgi:hypothetical protein